MIKGHIIPFPANRTRSVDHPSILEMVALRTLFASVIAQNSAKWTDGGVDKELTEVLCKTLANRKEPQID